MRAAGQHEEAIVGFRRAFERLVEGESGLLKSSELEPVSDVPTLEQLPPADGRALERVAAVRLNGGLATTMGLREPKSLVQVREGRSFLDIIIGQTTSLRQRYGIELPLLLMNSEVTRKQTDRALRASSQGTVAEDFLQGIEPKLDAETFEPVSWPERPSLEWCPPGHGDVYGALRRSGMLARLLERGIEYAMISNSDNLGATVDPRIAAYLEREQAPFLMEVVEGTKAERKGGHIARREDGRLVLRESAQVPPEDSHSFGDYRHWHYFNTNNLWVSLRALDQLLERRDGVLELPLIQNSKTVDPRDPDTPAVIQLESAMGAAIGVFDGARVLCVPRTRFAPVKTTDDLLVVRSDVYRLTDDWQLQPVPERAGSLPFVELDSRYYKLLDQFEARFPDGPPSLREAERFVVKGDVTFGAGVVIRGSAEVEAG